MNFDYEKYDIIDIFEENANQLVLMAIENTNYEDVVIINKITKSNFINSDFVHNYRSISSNVVSISETDEQIIIVNNYKDTQLLTDYLKDNTFDFTERTRIAKSFLTQVCNYSPLSYSLQQLLVKTDQLTIKNNLLIFSDYLFLDDYNSEVDFLDIMSSIGQTLKIILQLHKEALTNEMSMLVSLIETLITGDAEFKNHNDIYNEFKILISNMNNQSEIIQYTDLSKLDNITSEKPKLDLEFIKNKQKVKLAKASPELIRNSKLKIINNSIKTPKTNDTDLKLDFEHQTIFEIDEEDFEIKYVEDDDTPSILYTEEEYDESNLEIDPNFEDSFLSQDDEISEIKTETIDEHLEEDFSVEFNEDDVIEHDLFVYEENNISSEIISILNDLNLEETKKNLIIKEELKSMEDSTTNDLLDIEDDSPIDDYDNILPDSLFENWLDNEYSSTEIDIADKNNDIILNDVTDEGKQDNLEVVLDDVTEETKQADVEVVLYDVVEETKQDDIEDVLVEVAEETKLDDVETVLDDVVEETKQDDVEAVLDDLVEETKQEDAEAVFDDLLKNTEIVNDKIITINETNVIQDGRLNHIDDILDRNKNDDHDFYILDNKSTNKNSYHIPSFMLFFIFLLIITTLLLYYTFTYI